MASLRTKKTTEPLELEKGDFDHAVGAYHSIKGTLVAFSRKRLEVTRHIISSSWTKKATQQWFNVRTRNGKRRNGWRRFIL